MDNTWDPIARVWSNNNNIMMRNASREMVNGI